MKKENIFTLALVIVILAAIFLLFFLPEKKPILVGGDKDSHGCLIGAGYSWDDAKQKCVRVWEEVNKTYCNHTNSIGIFCAQIYSPVCGFFNETIKCIKYPCAENYGNPCEACKNPSVEYYMNGSCPSN